MIIKEDNLEKSIREKVKKGFCQNAGITMVSNSYIDKLNIVQNHLKTLYGDKADWRKAIERYKSSDEYKNSCRVVKNINEIPEITIKDLNVWIKEEEEYNKLADRLLEDEKILNVDSVADNKFYLNALIDAGCLLGILPIEPDNTNTVLQYRIIDYNLCSDSDMEDLRNKLSARETRGLLPIIIKGLSDDYVDGIINKYPGAGEVMQQRRTKYFYRGENAFYGKSQPSAYRHRSDRPFNKLPFKIQTFIEDLRAEEARQFLLQFDAVKYWNYGTPAFRALCQHYGLWTTMMDITSDIKTALFFACCKWKDGKWYPLDKTDFEKKDSRKFISDKGGDSRYGVLYRSPTEITTLSYGIRELDKNGKYDEFEIITPVGFQPFMRCRAQSAYIKCSKNPAYDMYKDDLFEKYKFRHSEELCNWIYEEMGKGELIYPRNDVPDISGVMSEINTTHVFSEKAFDQLCKHFNATSEQISTQRNVLKSYGYEIRSSGKNYITNKQIGKWNKRYSLQKVIDMVGEKPKTRPILVISAK